MKKVLSVFIAVITCAVMFAGCSEEGAAVVINSYYNGILTKIKLGMPLTKIITLQPEGVELYYQDDVTIWSINPDTDLMEIKNLIPVDDMYYYADDSIITYYFNEVEGDEELYLRGYSQEVHCLLDRATAEEYFNNKTAELVSKYSATNGSAATGSMIGTEDIDMDLVYTQSISASSYDVDFSMTLTYDTVNGVEGYYATLFEIKLMEKAVKESVPLDSGDETTKASE